MADSVRPQTSFPRVLPGEMTDIEGSERLRRHFEPSVVRGAEIVRVPNADCYQCNRCGAYFSLAYMAFGSGHLCDPRLAR